MSLTINEIYQDNEVFLFQDGFAHYLHNTAKHLPELLCVPNQFFHEKFNHDYDFLNLSPFQLNQKFGGKKIAVYSPMDFSYINFTYPYSVPNVRGLAELDNAIKSSAFCYLLNRNLTYIYLIVDPDTGYTKIGYSNNPKERLKALKKQPTLLPKPHNFQLINFWHDVTEVEAVLHKQFLNKRVRGEWFNLTSSDIQAIDLFFQARQRATASDSYYG